MDNATQKLGLYDPFELPNGKKVRIKKPSIGDVEKVNLLTSEYAGKLIESKTLKSRKEIEGYIKDQGSVADETKERIVQNFQQMKLLEEEYERIDDTERREAIMTELRELQIGVLGGISEMSELLNISLEAQIERRKRIITLQLTTLNAEDGTLYWPTIEALENDEDIESYNIIAIRFSETQGVYVLDDEQRYALQSILLTGQENQDTLEEITNII